MEKDDVIIMRIPAHLKVKAKELAQSQGRTLSGFIQALIVRELGPAAKPTTTKRAR